MTEQNAPERIHAHPQDIGGPCDGWDWEGWWHIDPGANGPGVVYVRADLYDAAIRREKALLASNDEDRKGLVEAASLRHRLKVMTAERDAAWNDAIEAAAAVSGNYMSDEADELLLDMWREDVRALRREPSK